MTSLFKTPNLPKPPPEAPMPDPEDVKARLAKKNAMLDAQKRRGRESTILAPLGTVGDAKSTTLGGGPA